MKLDLKKIELRKKYTKELNSIFYRMKKENVYVSGTVLKDALQERLIEPKEIFDSYAEGYHSMRREKTRLVTLKTLEKIADKMNAELVIYFIDKDSTPENFFKKWSAKIKKFYSKKNVEV